MVFGIQNNFAERIGFELEMLLFELWVIEWLPFRPEINVTFVQHQLYVVVLVVVVVVVVAVGAVIVV